MVDTPELDDPEISALKDRLLSLLSTRGLVESEQVITLANRNEYRYVPGRSIEIRTFEVKTYEALDITSVYEALSHRRAAHFAHVLVYVPEYESGVAKPLLPRVIADAEEYGVGVTTLADPRDYNTWRVEVAARRANPDPAAVNAFIYAQTGETFKDRVLSWCRRV